MVGTKRRHARSRGLFSRVDHHIGPECHDGQLPLRSTQGTNLADTAQAIHDGDVNVHQHQIEIGLTGLREPGDRLALFAPSEGPTRCTTHGGVPVHDWRC